MRAQRRTARSRSSGTHRSSRSLASFSCTQAATAALIWSGPTSTPTPAACSNAATSMGSLPTCGGQGRRPHGGGRKGRLGQQSVRDWLSSSGPQQHYTQAL